MLVFQDAKFYKIAFSTFLTFRVTLRGQKKFLAKLIIFPNSGDQNTPTLTHKLFFRKIFIFEKSVQSGNSEKIYIPMPYQVGDFFIFLSSIYTFNGISISFIIFRSRFKFILTPLNTKLTTLALIYPYKLRDLPSGSKIIIMCVI